MRARHICERVIRQVQLLAILCVPKRQTTLIQKNILGILGIRGANLKARKGKWCLWVRPREGQYKLNVDGSDKDGVITGGGIIRDAQGHLVVAFSSRYGNGTNNMAEFLALKEGIDLCNSLQLTNVTGECDSQLVVDAISLGRLSHWRLIHIFRLCRRHFPESYTIHHSFRQTNVVAGRLAAWAHSHLDRVEIFNKRDLPTTIRTAIRAEQLAMWNFKP